MLSVDQSFCDITLNICIITRYYMYIMGGARIGTIQMYQGGTSFVVHLFDLCLVFVMLSHLFIAALWSPAGEM